MSNIGYATLSVIPSAKGFGSALSSQVDPQLAAAGAGGGSTYGGGMLAGLKKYAAPIAAVFGGLAVVGLIKDSVNLEASFSQTMATMAAVTGEPKSAIKGLSDLAIKMGADTSFSASEASQAMLELAKGGLSAATISGGALEGTLTLAAAGGTDLGTAATIASNALNTFGLAGSDMAAVAAALAGGANASSASVESLGQALGQVGPGAKNAGLNLNQTVGVLSAFDAAGIKGSDAGTSLKTMLANLVPQTKKAARAMSDLGLDFVDASGNFLDIGDISEQLKTKMSGLSESARTTALSTIFGSDATRAATVLMNEGAEGINKYVAATMDQNAAQNIAAARMSGTAGALERFKGSLETAKLQLGQLLAPLVVKAADGLSAGLNAIAPGVTALVAAFQAGGSDVTSSGFAGAMERIGLAARGAVDLFNSTVVPGIRALVAAFQAGGSDVTSSGFAGVMERIGLGARAIADVVTGTVIPAVQSFVQEFQDGTGPGGKFRDLLPFLAGGLGILATHLGTVIDRMVDFGSWMVDNKGKVAIFAAVITTLLLPVFVNMAVKATISAATQVAAWVAASTGGVTSAASQLASHYVIVGGWVMSAAAAIRSGAETVAIWTLYKVEALAGAATAVGGLLAIAGGWIASAATATASAVVMAAAWLIGLGPVAWIITAIIAVGATFVLLYNKVDWFRSAVDAVWEWIKNSAVTAWEWIKSHVKVIVEGLLIAITGPIGLIAVLIYENWDKIKSTTVAVWGSIVDFFAGIPQKIKDVFVGSATWLRDIGTNLIQGLLNGAGSMLSKIGEFFLDKVPAFIREPFKKALGINSPSRLFMGYGQNLVEGVILGVGSMQSQLDASMAGLVAVPDVASPDFPSSRNANGAGAAGAKVIQHIYPQPGMSEQQVGDFSGRAAKRALTGVGS